MAQSRPGEAAKDHAQIVGTAEAVLDADLSLRQGNVARGMARLALLLAAMEQSVLDEEKWNLRAATLLGLPSAPLQNYRAPTAEQKPSGSGHWRNSARPTARPPRWRCIGTTTL